MSAPATMAERPSSLRLIGCASVGLVRRHGTVNRKTNTPRTSHTTTVMLVQWPAHLFTDGVGELPPQPDSRVRNNRFTGRLSTILSTMRSWPHSWLDRNMTIPVYTGRGICFRHHRGTEPPGHPRPAGIGGAGGQPDRATASD